MSSSILFCLVKGPGIRLFSATWPGFVLTLTFHFTVVTLYNNLTFSLCTVTWDIIIYITMTMSDLTFDSNLMLGLCTLNWLYAVTWYLTSFNNNKRGAGGGGGVAVRQADDASGKMKEELAASGWWSSFCRKSLEIKSFFHFSNLSSLVQISFGIDRITDSGNYVLKCRFHWQIVQCNILVPVLGYFSQQQ